MKDGVPHGEYPGKLETSGVRGGVSCVQKLAADGEVTVEGLKESLFVRRRNIDMEMPRRTIFRPRLKEDLLSASCWARTWATRASASHRSTDSISMRTEPHCLVEASFRSFSFWLKGLTACIENGLVWRLFVSASFSVRCKGERLEDEKREGALLDSDEQQAYKQNQIASCAGIELCTPEEDNERLNVERDSGGKNEESSVRKLTRHLPSLRDIAWRQLPP
jgi:hypothetical protein